MEVAMDSNELLRIRKRVDEMIVARLSGEQPATIEDAEQLALDVRQEAGRIVVDELGQGALGGPAVSDAKTSPQKSECSCGRFGWFKGLRPHFVVTLCGAVRVRRAYYYCRRCDEGFCPADGRLGIGSSSFTPRVQQEVARLCSSLSSFAAAVETLSDLTGVSVSESSALRLVEAAGHRAEAFLDVQRESAFEGTTVCKLAPKVLYLEADGVMTPTTKGYRETKVGVAFDQDGKNLRYTSHLGDCQTFGERWYALAVESGLLNAMRVVILSDGAVWLRNQAQFHFPSALHILDFWHAVEHVWEFARLAFGEGTQEAADWVAARREELLTSNLSDVLRSIQLAGEQFPAVKADAAQKISYFTSNSDRMDYARYLAEGLHIGSGAVESACKRVVTQRLKGAGMRWKESSAQTIARLRCLILSMKWKQFAGTWSTQAYA